MIQIEEYIVIHTLHKQGHSIRAISRITSIDRRTISKRLRQEELVPYKARTYKSKLDSFKDYISRRLKQALPNRIPASVIYDEILALGYQGKVRILQSHMKNYYEEESGLTKVEEIIRFETAAGYQAQVDWTPIRNGKKPIYAFVMILGYSRAAFVCFTDSMRQEVWQDCHEKAFHYFGGTCQTILYDNLKSVIIQRDKYGLGKHGFNQDFLDFSKYNFVPKLCRPNRPQTKGKVERFNQYLKRNFYVPLRASLKGSGLELRSQLLNERIFTWLEKSHQRIHGTTGEKPADRLQEEKAYLSAYLPQRKSKPSSSQSKQEAIIKSKQEIVKLDSALADIDISYFTSLSDYEEILKQEGKYAS